MKYKFLILLFIGIMISCEQNNASISNDDRNLHELLLGNSIIKENLSKIFDIDNHEKPKVFKVIISRRDKFVRITIYQIFYNSELEELPLGAINYKRNIFLYYNGSELIFKNAIGRKQINEMLKKSNIILENSFSKIYDSRVFQFDIRNNNKLKINFPAISPFDEELKKEEFWGK